MRLTNDRQAGLGATSLHIRARPAGQSGRKNYSTVTDFARFLGWSTLHPRSTAIW
jgi:hypothetical protein